MSSGTVEGLRESVRGESSPRTTRVRGCTQGVQRDDRSPIAFVVRCAGTDDVVAAVVFAQAARFWRYAEEGTAFPVSNLGRRVVIDLSGMRNVEVDAEQLTARAGGGTTWGVFNDATYPHGLATTGGSCPRQVWAGSPSAAASATSREEPASRATTS